MFPKYMKLINPNNGWVQNQKDCHKIRKIYIYAYQVKYLFWHLIKKTNNQL